MKKLYPEESVQAIADAIRAKKDLQIDKAGKMKIADMAKKISGIRLGCPINVSMHMQDGVWVRPDGWPDLDALECGEDELYMTFDASSRIDDPFCSFVISGADYTVTIGSQSWTKGAGSTFQYTFTDSDGTYPLVHVKADGHITSFAFVGCTTNGRTYSRKQNPLVERVGDVYDYGSGSGWGTYYLEREKVVRHACASVSLAEQWNGCYSLQSLDVSGWDTTNWAVTSLYSTWSGCYSLQSLDLSGWDTTNWNVSSILCMVYELRSLRKLDLSFLDMSKITEWTSSSYPQCTYEGLEEFVCGENNYGKFVQTYAYVRIMESIKLTHDSIVEFGKMLAPVTTKHYFQMGSELSNKLTTAEKAEITAKGWTII